MLAITLLVAAGCTEGAVEWSGSTVRVELPSRSARLGVDSRERPIALVPPPVTDPPEACPGSVRAAARGATLFIAWWTPGPNGSASVSVARSTTGGATWTRPLVVETRDRGTRGCSRPPLAIAVGEGSEYLHVVYWIEPEDGAGVFFAHSMDAGGMFHAPVAVAYGAVPARADVASVGDTVVVAHEDPNSSTPRMLMAVSRTAGHIFEQRFPVPAEGDPQPAPRVALRGNRVFAGWLDAGGKTLVVRSGILQDKSRQADASANMPTCPERYAHGPLLRRPHG